MNLSHNSKRNLFYLLSAMLGLALYYQTFHAGFQMDSVMWIEDNTQIRNLANLGLIWKQSTFRFLTHLSFALNFHYQGLNAFGYHAVNFGIHLLAAFSVFGLIYYLFQTPAVKKTPLGGQAFTAAIFGSLIFLVHPLQTQAVNYIVQRATSLATLFYLLSLVTYLKFRRSGKWPYYFLSLALTYTSMYTKPIVLTLPAMMVLIELCFYPGEGWKRFAWLLPFWGALSILWRLDPYVATRPASGIPLPVEPGALSRKDYFLTQLHVVLTYWKLCVFPVGQNLDYDYPVIYHLWNTGTLLALSFHLLVLGAAFILVRRFRLISFGIFWFYGALSLESSVIPLRDVIFEHRMYLPMVGFCILLVSTLLYAVKNVKLTSGILICSVAALSVLTFQRNRVWSNEVLLWQDIVNKSPQKERARNNLGMALMRKGKLDEAIAAFQKALELNPDHYISYLNIGVVKRMQKKWDDAIKIFKDVIASHPEEVEAYHELCFAYLKKEKYQEALPYCQQTTKMDPYYINGYVHSGDAYVRLKQYDKALAAYGKAIALDPRHGIAMNGMAYTFGEMGRNRDALEYYMKAIDAGLYSAQALSNVAYIYNQMGQYDQAIEHAKLSLILNPDEAEAFNNLGVAYARSKRFPQAAEAFQMAVKKKEDYVEAYDNWGAASGAMGDLKKEEALYRKALSIDPRSGETYYKLAYCLEQQGNREEAIRNYQNAIRLNPGNSQAINRLVQLSSQPPEN